MIGSSVDYVRSGGMRNVPVTKAVEHLYATTIKFSACVILASRPAYSYPPRRVRVKTMPSVNNNVNKNPIQESKYATRYNRQKQKEADIYVFICVQMGLPKMEKTSAYVEGLLIGGSALVASIDLGEGWSLAEEVEAR
ncbi:hypothetical protein AVEN_118942-1 [Araneus ventricosus]|uniref:Uncharacterized protein n=1 Tax=Araneus ventricosus TaxID=182803 RepID=A0A4Y2BZ74_ARAVE|nr:hypothetical protein AVEN_118942-1 [Araneus ventricosus]